MKRCLSLSRSILLLAVALASLTVTASAIPVAGGAVWGTPGNNGPDLKLGRTNQETCFLSGVSGSLTGIPHISGQFNSTKPASAAVFMKDGFWWVRTRAGIGTGVMAHVTCVFATANRTGFSWSAFAGGDVPATPNRHCFLREVWATTGMGGGQGGLMSQIKIRKVNNKFTMHGSHVDHVAGEGDYGGASAVCVDLPATSQWEFTFVGPPKNQFSSATKTETLRDSFPNGAPVPVANVGCFLTGVAGNWISGDVNPLGFNNGAFLTGHLEGAPHWKMTTSNGRTGVVKCLR